MKTKKRINTVEGLVEYMKTNTLDYYDAEVILYRGFNIFASYGVLGCDPDDDMAYEEYEILTKCKELKEYHISLT